MSIAPILRPRILVMFALALILSVSAYGFAAANTVPASSAGDGATAISGYDITNVAYTLDSSTPTKITSVSFDIAPKTGGVAAGSAKIKLFDAESAYHTCDVTTTPGSAVCAITGGVLTSLADNLSVVATSN